MKPLSHPSPTIRLAPSPHTHLRHVLAELLEGRRHRHALCPRRPGIDDPQRHGHEEAHGGLLSVDMEGFVVVVVVVVVEKGGSVRRQNLPWCLVSGGLVRVDRETDRHKHTHTHAPNPQPNLHPLPRALALALLNSKMFSKMMEMYPRRKMPTIEMISWSCSQLPCVSGVGGGGGGGIESRRKWRTG
jgi:hypothetical protein